MTEVVNTRARTTCAIRPDTNRIVSAIARRGTPLANGPVFSGDLHVHRALPRPPVDDEPEAPPSALQGILSHLDAVYGFAFTLTGGDAKRAEELTEEVFASVRDDLWSTLGRRLRDRLLARCVAAYREGDMPPAPRRSAMLRQSVEPSPTLRDLVLRLPWNERAAIALVDQLGLTYAAGAPVLGTNVTEFRTLLHRGRSTLLRSGTLARRPGQTRSGTSSAHQPVVVSSGRSTSGGDVS